MSLPRASFAAFARGLGQSAGQHASTGLQFVRSSRLGRTTALSAFLNQVAFHPDILADRIVHGSRLPCTSHTVLKRCIWTQHCLHCHDCTCQQRRNVLGSSNPCGCCSVGGRSRPGTAQPARQHAAAQQGIIVDDSSPWDGPHPGLGVRGQTSDNPMQRRAQVGIVRLPQSLLAPKQRPLRPARPHAGDRASRMGAAAARLSKSPDEAARLGATQHEHLPCFG